jgi:diguanylate cyclase (GGDEF)-like protein
VSILDATTLFVVGGLVVILAGISFLLETLLRRNDAVGRLWSVFFLGTMFAVFAFIVVSLQPENWWALAIGNGAYVVAIGFLWCGARRSNMRSTLLGVPLALGAVVTVAALLPGESGGFWAGAVEMFIGVAVVCLLAAFEFTRRDLGRMLASRVITVLIGGLGIFYLGRAFTFVAYGPENPIFADFFGTEVSTLLEICFAVIGTIMLASVQGERFAVLSENDVEIGARLRIDGVLNGRTFRELAETWLLRALRDRTTLVLILVDVADLPSINTAFGRAAGDAAIRATGRVVLTQSPTASLVGHLTPRRFAVLLELPASQPVEAITDRIGEAVLGEAIDDQDRFRASTFRGVATTRTSGTSYGDLLTAAVDAVQREVDAAQAAERAARSS